jgi:hypothetical protein
LIAHSGDVSVGLTEWLLQRITPKGAALRGSG